MTLLARLFILVLLAVLPAIGIQIYSVLEQRAEREAEVTLQAERLLRLVEGEHFRIIDSARLMVTALSESRFLRRGEIDNCQSYLERLAARSVDYRTLSISDAEGRILCSADPARIGASLAVQPHFRRAMSQGRFAVGEWTVSHSGDVGGELPVAAPYVDSEGRRAGVVAVSLDVPRLTAMFAARPMPENTTLTVADRSGTILVKLGTPGRAGERLPDSYLALLSERETGVAMLPGLDGVSRILAYSPPSAGIRDLFISVGVDRGAAMGVVDRATRDGLLMTLSGFLVAAAAAWIGGTLFIRRPVDALVRAARDWSEGKTATRVKLSDRSSEIGQLGHAFDMMAGRLEAREAALRQSESHIRAVLDALPAYVGVLTPDGAVAQVNRAAADAAGLPPARIIGRPFDEICWLSFDDAGRERLRQALALGAGGRSSRFDAGLRLSAGRDAAPREMTVDVNLTPMVDADGHVTHLIATGIDITERKRTEEALRVAEERVRTGLRNSGVVVFNQDRDLRYTWSHSEWLGFSPDGLIGRTDADLFDQREDADGMMALKRRVLDSGIGAREEVRIRCKGEERFFDLTVDPLRDPSGRVEGVTCAAVDVTDRKKAEAELHRAREEADQANDGKSKFLAAASHDLRQPVQSLYLFTAALSDRLQGHSALPILDNIRQGLDTLKSLLDGLLDMSRLESGKIVAAPVEVRLNQLLGRLVAEYGPRAAQKGLELRAVPTRVWVRTDPAHLERILRNLVENALRYTAKGKVLLGCRRTPSGMRVEVWDTGSGIPADRLEDIFEEFTQLGERSERGLGLGLAIVKRLSRLLGHPVTVRSWEGKGSVFSVELPRVILGTPRAANGTAAAAATLARRSAANDAADSAANDRGQAISAIANAFGGGRTGGRSGGGAAKTIPAPVAAPPVAAPPVAMPATVGAGSAAASGAAASGTAKGMVLVIDDEAIILLGLKAILEGWGYDVLTAKSGDQALERLRADGRCPQIVLADYQLQQGRTGPEAVSAVQTMLGQTVPGIILTGDTNPERQEEAERRGFRLLHKPVFPNDLRRMMASAGAA
ncbi:PAS domain-containing protein [Azospirillum sp. YIM B02556]|uniref:histidine kinase n=1 Tax=Azospirillum endophyticum TaxID=2800326 RepID=A0ABS1EZ27_9PROT|nr:PAS domain-containing protein [Azospirillum endophyticum]MBK1836421.1 PAS domain-containing protein [Azospirillum endophyticum]